MHRYPGVPRYRGIPTRSGRTPNNCDDFRSPWRTQKWMLRQFRQQMEFDEFGVGSIRKDSPWAQAGGGDFRPGLAGSGGGPAAPGRGGLANTKTQGWISDTRRRGAAWGSSRCHSDFFQNALRCLLGLRTRLRTGNYTTKINDAESTQINADN